MSRRETPKACVSFTNYWQAVTVTSGNPGGSVTLCYDSCFAIADEVATAKEHLQLMNDCEMPKEMITTALTL